MVAVRWPAAEVAAFGGGRGGSITAAGSFDQMRRVVTGALTNASDSFLLVVVGMIIAVLTGVLLVYWLVRTGVLILLVGIAVCMANACSVTVANTPSSERYHSRAAPSVNGVAWQASATGALSIFLDPNASVAALGLPRDPTGTLNLFIVACLLWVTVKIPGMVRRWSCAAVKAATPDPFCGCC